MKHVVSALMLSSIALSGITISQPVQALSYYTDISVTRQKISANVGTAKPYMSRIKLGVDYSRTLAAEFIYGGSLQDDTIGNLIVEVEDLTGIYLRYNTSYHNKVRMYLLAGKTEVTLSDFGQSKKELSDTSLGIGFEEIAPWENTFWVLEYVSYIKDGGTSIKGITFGVKFGM